MRRILALLLFTSLLATAQNLGKLDTENGFRGKKFGVLLSTFKNMLFITGSGEVKIFQDRNEDLWFGNGSAKKITYEFYKEKFYKVNIEIQGNANAQAALKYMQEQYGNGVKVGGGVRGESLRWQGTKVNADYKEIPLGARIEIVSKEFEARMDRDKDKQD